MGSYVWHDGTLGRVRAKGYSCATIAVFAADATPRRVTGRTNVTFAMSDSGTAHYDLPPLLVDTAAPGKSGRVHVRCHEVRALRAVANHISSPVDSRYEPTCSAAPSVAGSQGYTRVHEFKFEFGGGVELEFEFEFEFRNSHELETLTNPNSRNSHRNCRERELE